MTESFIAQRFSTEGGQPARQAAGATAQVLELARRREISWVLAAWDPGSNRAEVGYWACRANRPVPGVRGLPHPQALPAVLGRRRDEPVIRRVKPSAFFGIQLAGPLTYRQVDTIIVAGISTSGCVPATVIDGFSSNDRVIAPEERAADRASIPHKVNLFDMHMEYGHVLPRAQVLTALRSRGPGGVGRPPGPGGRSAAAAGEKMLDVRSPT